MKYLIRWIILKNAIFVEYWILLLIIFSSIFNINFIIFNILLRTFQQVALYEGLYYIYYTLYKSAPIIPSGDRGWEQLVV